MAETTKDESNKAETASFLGEFSHCLNCYQRRLQRPIRIFLNSYFGYLCTLLLVFVNTAQVFELKDEAVIASSYLFLLDPNDDKLIKIEPVFPLKPKEDFC